MKKDKNAAAVSLVQPVYTLCRYAEKFVVLRHFRFFRIREVGQDGKIKVRVKIRYVSYFQLLNLADN